jgi:hypothetical protein
LVRKKDLAEWLIMVGASVRFFDSLDVLGLRNGGTQPIRGAEHLNEGTIMDDRMLAGKGEALGANRLTKNFAVQVKTGHGLVYCNERLLVDY